MRRKFTILRIGPLHIAWRKEKRAAESSLENPSSWLVDLIGGGASKSGVSVNQKTALGLTAFWQGVRIISETVATLPIGLYQVEDNGNISRLRQHPADRILRNPSPYITGYKFKETMQAIATVRGNAYALIERDNGARVMALHVLNPWRVTPYMSGGEKFYRVNGLESPVHHLDMLHIYGVNIMNTLLNDEKTLGHVGENPVAIGRDSLSVSIAAQDMDAHVLGNGGHIPGFLSIEGKMDKSEREKVEESFWKRYTGANNAGRIPLLAGGMDYKKVALTPQEAMVMDSRKYGVDEVARILNISPYKLGMLDRATFNNIEQLAREFYIQTARPWTENWESELEMKLLTEAEKAYGNREFRFDFFDLLRGDSKALSEFIRTLFNAGMISINDGRRMIGQNQLSEDWANKHWLQTNISETDNRPQPKDITPPSNGGESKSELNGKLNGKEHPLFAN